MLLAYGCSSTQHVLSLSVHDARIAKHLVQLQATRLRGAVHVAAIKETTKQSITPKPSAVPGQQKVEIVVRFHIFKKTSLHASVAVPRMADAPAAGG